MLRLRSISTSATICAALEARYDIAAAAAGTIAFPSHFNPSLAVHCHQWLIIRLLVLEIILPAFQIWCRVC